MGKRTGNRLEPFPSVHSVDWWHRLYKLLNIPKPSGWGQMVPPSLVPPNHKWCECTGNTIECLCSDAWAEYARLRKLQVNQ
jgi:hypothetical protein